MSKRKSRKALDKLAGVSRIDRLVQDLHTVRDGKPVKQTVVRRMKVNGKTVYADETFTAPVKGSK